jgi:hypothetical protein
VAAVKRIFIARTYDEAEDRLDTDEAGAAPPS